MADRRALMMANLAEYGLLIERPNDGHLVANPVVAMLSTLEVQMNRVAASLGLTPADRTRMGLAEVKARSAFEQMLADRAGRVQK
jgi:P27 family predicted phage terminase small subunit